MTDTYGKRARDSSEDGGRPTKREATSSSRMVEDFLESMDPSVRIKLRSMFDDGLLMYSDLDERNITELGKFDASVALAILEHYCSGDLSQVRNRRAYLAGAIKRRAHMARDTYEPPTLAPDGLPVLLPEVQRRLEQVESRSPKVSELDQRSLDALAALPPSCAVAALDRFGAMDFTAVRNPSALFMSIVRNIMETEPEDRDWGPPSRGGDGYRGGPPHYRDPYDRDPYDRDPYREPHDRDPYRDPAPPPPPPPRRAAALQPPYAAAAGSLPPGTLVTAGAGGGLVVAGTGLVGALQASLPGLQPLSGGGGVPAGAPGLMLAAAPGAGGVPQYIVVSGSSSTGLAQQGGMMQVLGGQALQLQAAPLAIGLQQQQPEPLAPTPAVAQVVSQEWAAGRRNHGVEQGQLGVRVSEFHDLSPYAVYVNPSPALKLQQLWDNGNELVSMLDDKVWRVLAEMPAPEALAAIGEAADALDKPGSHVRNINALFMSVVRKVWPQHGHSSAVYSHNGHQTGGYSGSRGDIGAAAGGGGGGGGPPHHHHQQQHQHHRPREPAIHLLPPEQRLLAQSLCKSHAPLLTEEHFDEGVIESLRRLSHEKGMSVLHELGTNDMAGVRNVPAYIMGIAKRYSTGQRKVSGGGGGGRLVG